jgi:hypothetical protein
MLSDNTIARILRGNAWTYGNKSYYIDRAYYAGVEAGNPSGNVNVKTEKFYDLDGLSFTITYNWDLNDNNIKETCS